MIRVRMQNEPEPDTRYPSPLIVTPLLRHSL
jgi:hypothetical protein